MTVTAPMLVALCAVASPFVLLSPFAAEKVARWRRTRRRTASLFARPLTPGDGGTPGPAPRLAGSGVNHLGSGAGACPPLPAGPTAGFLGDPTVLPHRDRGPERWPHAAGGSRAACGRHTPGGAR